MTSFQVNLTVTCNSRFPVIYYKLKYKIEYFLELSLVHKIRINVTLLVNLIESY